MYTTDISDPKLKELIYNIYEYKKELIKVNSKLKLVVLEEILGQILNSKLDPFEVVEDLKNMWTKNSTFYSNQNLRLLCRSGIGECEVVLNMIRKIYNPFYEER